MKNLYFSTSSLLLISVSLTFALISGELPVNNRYFPDFMQPQNYTQWIDEIDSAPVQGARKYLGKFGWVNPPDWTAISPRFNESDLEGETETILVGSQRPHVSYTSNNKAEALSDEEFAAALRSFQEANELNATGVLDNDTMLKMDQVRCGVPDQTRSPNQTLSESAANAILANNNVASDSSSIEEVSFSGDDTTVARTTTGATIIPKIVRRKRHALDKEERSFNANLQQFGHFRLPERDSIKAHFDAFANDWISEGELPPQTRVESMEEILMALRREKMAGKAERSPLFKPSSPASSSSSKLLNHIMLAVGKYDAKSRRRKRSYLYRRDQNGWGLAFAKNTITWRLVDEWSSTNTQFMNSGEVWFTVKLAFRMWSEILPRNFREDNTSPVSDVDILVGFGRGSHNRCPVEFNNKPLMREYAHAWPLPKAEIHFNDVQPFVPIGWVPTRQCSPNKNCPISLLKVALHEIGHTIGLPHNNDRVSVMNPYYHPFQNRNIVELGVTDRARIQKIYGSCEISFDVVFDWVRQVVFPNGRKGWKYNTYFFRRDWFWLYENREGRPRYGDPKLIADFWRGVMLYPSDPHEKLDGAVHIRSYRDPNGQTFFFKGDSYIEYDNINDRVKTHDGRNRTYPRKISQDFPGVPSSIDTVFYKFSEDVLYFFKGNLVYRYNWSSGRVVSRELISKYFPGWGGASPLPSNIDGAYFSYAYQAYYFFKGKYYWKLADNRERRANRGMKIPNNAVGPRQKISSKWKYICDVGGTELAMTL